MNKAGGLHKRCGAYLSHLFNRPEETQSLHQIVPNTHSSQDEVVEFHKALCASAPDFGAKFFGVKVVPASHEVIKGYNGTKMLMCPIIVKDTERKHFSLKQLGIQNVEPCIALFIGTNGDRWEYDSVAPALEVTGSRFPFYAPSLQDYHCDLCGNIDVVLGKRLFIKPKENILSYHFAALHDGTPVSVGCGKLFEPDLLKTIDVVRSYVESLEVTFDENQCVLFTGVCPRSAATPGHFTMNWGKFGSASCTLL